MVLYQHHEISRARDGLFDFDPRSEKLKREIETGKFTILVSSRRSERWEQHASSRILIHTFTFQPERDESGAAIALFTANRHYPLTVDHQTTLQGIVFQLDVALEQLETLKAGLVFIFDMSGSKYSNFDYELSKKILTLLKVTQARVLADYRTQCCGTVGSREIGTLFIMRVTDFLSGLYLTVRDKCRSKTLCRERR